jgi:AMMECR1 domain-containing protein
LILGERMDHANEAPYPPTEQRKILELARHVLNGLFAGKRESELQCAADLLGKPATDRVNITLRIAGRIRGSMSAPGANLGRQVVQAVFRAAMDRRFGGPLTRWELSNTNVEVWIQTGSSEIDLRARFDKDVLLLGVEGLEIEGYAKSAYYKPSVAITSKRKTAVSLFEALCKKAGLDKNAWRERDVRLWKTHWVCLRNLCNAPSPGQERDDKGAFSMPLRSWVAECASYLVRNQDATGNTGYLYDPIADVFVPKRANLVRAGGCLFALSQVLQSRHHLAEDATFKAATVQMARALLGRTSLTGDGRRIVRERKPEKLPKVGATALLAAALSAGVLREEFPGEYQQLYRSVVSAQKPDGRFLTHFGETEENKRAANFSSGQALLVLALEAERGSAEALEVCRHAFHAYQLHFRIAPTSAFVGWHVDVWSRLALLTGNPSYAGFAFEQTDWLLKMQVEDHHDLRWIGGFSQSGTAPKFSSIVFVEATVRALLLAVRTGDTERTKKYTDCVRAGLQFCRQLRLEETPATLLASPMRCRGGVALGLVDRRVRCDVVQHFITLCLVAEQVAGYVQ